MLTRCKGRRVNRAAASWRLCILLAAGANYITGTWSDSAAENSDRRLFSFFLYCSCSHERTSKNKCRTTKFRVFSCCFLRCTTRETCLRFCTSDSSMLLQLSEWQSGQCDYMWVPSSCLCETRCLFAQHTSEICDGPVLLLQY